MSRSPEPPVQLEPFGPGRIEAMRPWLDDPALLRFTRIPDPQPPGFLEGWLRGYEDGRRDGTRDGFWVVGADDELLGLAVCPRIDAEARTAELGYVVAPEARGRGVGTVALELITEWALSERAMLRLELLIGVANEPSKRVAAKCGYTREGVLRSLYFKQGRHEDTEIWSRLASDPDPIEARRVDDVLSQR
jgi:RimJ/RimL family protein N-acetyltransferase